MTQTVNSPENRSLSVESFNAAKAAMEAARQAYEAARQQVAQLAIPVGSILDINQPRYKECIFVVQYTSMSSPSSFDVQALMVRSTEHGVIIERCSGMIQVSMEMLKEGIAQVFNPHAKDALCGVCDAHRPIVEQFCELTDVLFQLDTK